MILSKLSNYYQSLSKMKNKTLPISVSLIISRNLKKLAPIMEDYNEQRDSLVEKYAKKDENGIIINKEGSIPIDNPVAYTNDMRELSNTDVEITFDKIKTEDLKRCEEGKYDALTVEEIGVIDEIMLEE